MHYRCTQEGRKLTITDEAGRQAVVMLATGKAQDSIGPGGAQSVGKVGPGTKCGVCGRVMDEGEGAVYTAPNWPPSGSFTGYRCFPCILPPEAPAEAPRSFEDRVNDSEQDRARLALLEARVAALEGRC